MSGRYECRIVSSFTEGLYRHPKMTQWHVSDAEWRLYSKHATEVFLLLFDRAEGEPTDVIQLQHRTKFIWHVCVTGLQVGRLYGYKVRGEYRPERGLRFNE